MSFSGGGLGSIPRRSEGDSELPPAQAQAGSPGSLALWDRRVGSGAAQGKGEGSGAGWAGHDHLHPPARPGSGLPRVGRDGQGEVLGAGHLPGRRSASPAPGRAAFQRWRRRRGGGGGADGGGAAAAEALGGGRAAGGLRGLPGHGRRRAAGAGAAGRGAGSTAAAPGVPGAAGQPQLPAGARPAAAHGGEPGHGAQRPLGPRGGRCLRPGGRERGGSGTPERNFEQNPQTSSLAKCTAHISCPEEAARGGAAFRGRSRRAEGGMLSFPAAVPRARGF